MLLIHLISHLAQAIRRRDHDKSALSLTNEELHDQGTNEHVSGSSD